MKKILIICFTFIYLAADGQKPLPIIDMHVHANKADFAGPPPLFYCIKRTYWTAGSPSELTDTSITHDPDCIKELTSPVTDDDVMNKTLAIMKRRNVIAVTSGRLTEKWSNALPGRVIPSFYIRMDGKDPSVDSLRKIFGSGIYKVLGEIGAQYNGIAANDRLLEPFWALAEELNIPVGIHIGPGPYGAPYFTGPEYKASLHSPMQMEDVLKRHPDLRVYIMHAAWPMIDELLALMWTYPQVYVDISGIIVDLPRPAFYNYMRRITEVGFGNRILFGSDGMIWPEIMELAIKTIEEAPGLSSKEKRDILYNNAARFLKLSKEEIAKHHEK